MSIGNFLFGTADQALPQARARQAGIDQRLTGAMGQALSPYRSMAQGSGLDSIFSNYLRESMGQDPSQYRVNAPNMQYQNPLESVNQYLDPSMDFQMQQAQRGVEASAAGRGGLFSGAAGNQIAQNTQQIAQQGWGDAFNRAEQQRQAALGVQQQNFQNRMQGGQFNLGLDQTRLGNMGNALQAAYQPTNALAQGQMDLASQLYGTQSGMNQQQMQGQLANRGVFGDVLGAGANIFSAYLAGR